MSSLNEYANRYESFICERQSGVLTVRLHTEGGAFVFNERAHHDFGSVFTDIAGDPENRVVILTGTGDAFCAEFDHGSFYDVMGPNVHEGWMHIQADGERMLTAFLDIEVPVISVVNGPALSHSELPLLADVVLASKSASFQDATHFLVDLPPGDGMHVVWTTLLGLNRGRHFLMTGQILSAAEALALGVVAEVHPDSKVMDRAIELATDWASKSTATLRGTRRTLTIEWRRLIREQLHCGLTEEGLAVTGRAQMPPTQRVRNLR